MGKKRIVKQTQEELLRQVEKESAGGRPGAVKSVKKSKISSLSRGRLYIQSSYNNTVITLTDSFGRVVVWASAGSVGFSGPKKATPFAASKIIENLIEKTKDLGLKEVAIYVKGVGSGRESAIRALAARGIEISSIKDMTPMPHNGCRPRKPRRV